MSTSSTHDTRQHILDTAQDIIATKGYTAVGLNEILQAAGVPKGSFYHYFASKDAFGQALLEHYFSTYLQQLQVLDKGPGESAAQRLLNYLHAWLDAQSATEPHGKCLAVKLAAEVSDLSEPMRLVLDKGTEQVITRLAGVVRSAQADGTLATTLDAHSMATMLYHLWLGACLRAKITRNRQPLDAALASTRSLLNQT
ncbi:MAG TPA: TetR/AcrR family transcriptional regulator [Alcaligenes sp.]|nr:TetR/AcrR family transcriptional regulator [Alcaligenes sp.]HRL26879.1 TetR/AcrR family transcriptional regulator [Alcaligenes sp.]